MFEWARKLAEDLRIAWDYADYERVCRRQWVAEASAKFGIWELAHDLEIGTAMLMRDAGSFEAPLQALQASMRNTEAVLAEATATLAALQRDYETELDQAHATLHAVGDELTQCRARLASAHEAAKSAKGSLDNWYARAESGWLGNGGKKLPQHSFFGQDLSDRDRLKRVLKETGQEIARYKSERATLEKRRDAARATIAVVNDARQRMFELKKAGFDRRLVMGTIQSANTSLRTARSELATLLKAREEYLRTERKTRGLEAMEAEITRRKQARELRIEEFDHEPVAAARKARHREAWLAAQARS